MCPFSGAVLPAHRAAIDVINLLFNILSGIKSGCVEAHSAKGA